MKNTGIRFAAVSVIISILLSFTVISGSAADTQPSSYSSSSNSGTRHVTATTLSGTGADDYYNGSYEYDVLSGQSSSSILNSLRTLMKSTHKKNTSYNDCKDYADQTDCEKNSGKLVSIYTSYTTKYNTSTINREHVWPKSLGGYNTSGPGADLHHIRPSEINVNSNRGNLKYGEVSGGKTSTGSASNKVGGTYSGGYFEPVDNVKGDVARICLYMYVRYGGESSYTCGSITTVFQSVDVLLAWCELDPVDTWELGRNEVVEGIQGNRNVFIDYPEYAWLIFGREVPDDMTTPSGEAMEENTGSGSGNTGSNGGNTGSGSGNTGSDGGNTGSGSGNTGSDGGNTGSGSGNTGTADQKTAFINSVNAISGKVGEARFNAIKSAVEIYNKLTTAEKTAVAAKYSELKSLAEDYNREAANLNSENEMLWKAGLFILVPTTTAAALYFTVGKEFF